MMKKHVTSLRAYIDQLRDLGDVREITEEVDPHLELGAVIRLAVECNDPMPLFTRIRGCDVGYRVLGAPGALSASPDGRWARAAISLGLDSAAHPRAIVDALYEARSLQPIPPIRVDDAPCQENILVGADADLNRFPVPLIHDGDGGRYINTWGVLVVRTPDGTWTNWSIARVMQVDGRTMAAMINPPQDIGKIFAQWRAIDEPMPFALVQGAEPAVPFVAGMGLPSGMDEGGYLGGYFGEPLEVVRCRTVDLDVPATAEIVIEGHVSLDETVPEGPMGEFLGYVFGQPRQRNVFRISAITHRDDPILPVVSAGKPVEEDHTVVGLTYSAEALVNLRAAGLPVTTAWMVPESAVNVLAVTVPRDWKSRSAGAYTTTHMLTRAIAHVALRPKVGFWVTRVMVLDDDIDPSDLRDLMWGFATRCHPTRDALLMDDQRATPLHLFYTPEEQLRGSGPKIAYDCLLTPDEDQRPRSTAFADNFSADVRLRATQLWSGAA